MPFREIKTDLFSFPSEYHNEKQNFRPWEEPALEADARGWGPAPWRPAWHVAWPQLTLKGGPGELRAGEWRAECSAPYLGEW